MKRFLAFAYDGYYPVGGEGDYGGDFDTAEAAIAAVSGNEYLDLLDTQTGVWRSFTRKNGSWADAPWSGYATTPPNGGERKQD